MAFSLENHIAFSDSIYFEEFVEEQLRKRRQFIFKARVEFIFNIRRYFNSTHALSKLQTSERRSEESDSLITKFKKM